MDRRESVLKAIMKLHGLLSACRAEAAAPLDVMEMKVAQIQHLKTIDQWQDLTFSRFAEILSVTKPSVTEIVNKLIRLDCVEKHRCSVDGRIYYIRLTEKGKRISRQEYLRDQMVTDRILGVLDESELTVFIKLIDRITS
ncbi:MAG: winged helix-turn-helix transcriptional regulator [Proteobacteria bacterium]|nr:winged helix-turn-helix transcriptional regulator [Pseudomonadota bacterium]